MGLIQVSVRQKRSGLCVSIRSDNFYWQNITSTGRIWLPLAEYDLYWLIVTLTGRICSQSKVFCRSALLCRFNIPGSDWVEIFSGLFWVLSRKNSPKILKLVVYYVCSLYQTVFLWICCLTVVYFWQLSRYCWLVSYWQSRCFCEIMRLRCLLCARRFVVGCVEFDWAVGWVGSWAQSFHFAMGSVGLKKLDPRTSLP